MWSRKPRRSSDIWWVTIDLRDNSPFSNLGSSIKWFVSMWTSSNPRWSWSRSGEMVAGWPRSTILLEHLARALTASNVLDEQRRRCSDEFYRALDPFQLLEQIELLQDAFRRHANAEKPKAKLNLLLLQQPQKQKQLLRCQVHLKKLILILYL